MNRNILFEQKSKDSNKCINSTRRQPLFSNSELECVKTKLIALNIYYHIYLLLVVCHHHTEMMKTTCPHHIVLPSNTCFVFLNSKRVSWNFERMEQWNGGNVSTQFKLTWIENKFNYKVIQNNEPNACPHFKSCSRYISSVHTNWANASHSYDNNSSFQPLQHCNLNKRTNDRT